MRPSSLLLLTALALPLALHAGCSSDDEAAVSETSNGGPSGAAGASGGAGAVGTAGASGSAAGAGGSAGSSGNQGAGEAGSPGQAGQAGTAGTAGTAGAAGQAGAAGAQGKVIACGENVACEPGQSCYTWSGGGDCSNECVCDKTGHFVCPVHCGAAGPGAYTCDQGAVCMQGSPNFSCTSGNDFCSLSCTCANIDGSGKGALDCKETCKTDATPSPGKPCGPGAACEPYSGCGGLLDDGCTEQCTCGAGKTYECTVSCGGGLAHAGSSRNHPGVQGSAAGPRGSPAERARSMASTSLGR